jgi:hypothetical protein
MHAVGKLRIPGLGRDAVAESRLAAAAKMAIGLSFFLISAAVIS